MSIAVRISDDLVKKARSRSRALKRSIAGQIEYWAKIGEIADPFGTEEKDIRSPVSGMVIGRLNMPLVHRGDAVIHIAHLSRLKSIAPVVEEFKEDIKGNIG